MKVHSIDNNCKYNRNNIPFKAYIKPNANFHILYGLESYGANAKLVKQLNELPNHCIEILQLNKLKSSSDRVSAISDSVHDTAECIILNHTTKRTENITLKGILPLNQLITSIIGLKDKPFFKHKMGAVESELYKTLTTGKSLNEFIAKGIEMYYQ